MAEFTNRLAITKINCDAIKIDKLYHIFSNVLQNKELSLKKVLYKEKIIYVATFQSKNDAKVIYEFCDELEFKEQKEMLFLSIIPDEIQFNDILEEQKEYKEIFQEKNIQKASINRTRMPNMKETDYFTAKLDDSRFADALKDDNFALDASNPNFHKQKASRAFFEKRKQ
ncbi:hypothetical protein NUSPORA_00334 [Nucleospora cyclopteri]